MTSRRWRSEQKPWLSLVGPARADGPARAAATLGTMVIALATGFSSACEEGPSREPPSTGPAPTSAPLDDPTRQKLERELLQMRAEAGLAGESDPAAPVGDLAKEVAQVSSLQQCSEKHAVSDPLVADAIDALGYDTLISDSCRVLVAMHEKDVRACNEIASSALRSRCISSVAVFTENSVLCPFVESAGKSSGRDPVCLARALHDERLCAAATRSERATCRALVLANPALCERDAVCRRQVDRWRTVTSPAKPAKARTGAIRVRIEPTEDPSLESGAGSWDFKELAESGAVVRKSAGKLRIDVGSPRTQLWFAASSPLAEPRLFVEVLLKPDQTRDASIALESPWQKFDVLLPHVAELSSGGPSGGTVEVLEIGSGLGQPVRLRLTALATDAPHTFRLTVEVDTFIRDWIESGVNPSSAPQ